VPAEVSAQPLLGIFGVVLGAGVVTLTSRMISLGMPDFRGLHGFGYDESAWIGSAFDAGLMFIGPFTVFLGGLMGPRRILLTAAALFTVLFIFLPFAHSYSLVITLTLLSGLASGTFISTHAYVRPPEHSSSLPSFHTCAVRNLRGWGR